MRRASLSGGFLLATLALVLPARADAAAVTVSAPDSDVAAACPSGPELLSRTDALLGAAGKTLERAGAEGVAIEVRFSRAGSGFSAEIVLSGARTGRRVLSDPSPECDELSQSVALAVAIAIDPSFAAVEPEQPEPAPVPAPPPEPVRTSPIAPQPKPARMRSPEPPVVSFGVWQAVGASSLQTRPLALAAAAGFSFELFDAVTLRSGFLYVPPSSVELGPGSVELELFAASLDVCARARLGSTIALLPCLGPAVGRIRAESSGYLQNGSATRAWSALVLRTIAEARLSSLWGLFLDGAAWFPDERHAFEVGGVGSVQPMKTPGLSLLLGVSLRLW
jgi:hypothetical protein